MKAAIVYAQRLQWSVIPLYDAGTENSKRPRLDDWVNLASSDLATVTEWIVQYPKANIGVATGLGFFVLDVDPDKGGLESLAALEAQHGPLPITAKQRTGSGGFHYLFTMPDFRVTNSAGKVGPGLDIRGTGGQIVVSPSVSAKGRYTWVKGLEPWTVPLAPAPEWLLALLRPRLVATTVDAPRNTFPPATPEVLEQARKALEDHGPAIEGRGGDNHTHVAGRVLGNDFALTEAEAWPLFREWNADCQPPWGEVELQAKLRGGMRDGAVKPYGNRRTVDALAMVRALIETHRANPDDDRDCLKLIAAARQVTFTDPAARQRAEIEIKAYTDLGSLAIALPKVKAQPRELTEINSSWQGLDLSPSGTPVANIHNVVMLLTRANEQIGIDTFLKKVVKMVGGKLVEWTDEDDLQLTLRFQAEFKLLTIPPLVVSQGVQTYASHRKTNCAQRLIRSEEWDGVKRIATFFTRAFGAADDEYTRCASQNFLRGMIARILRPGCKVDTMPVFEGIQGLKKSSGLQALVGEEFFATSTESPNSKDFFMSLNGKILVELAEMDTLQRAEVSRVKLILSAPVDTYRASYDRRTRDWPRQGVFAGTTNADDWHRDDTGARRFWPITCTVIDLELIKQERLQLFAEAVHDVEAGESWWEMPKVATEEAQEARRQEHPWEDALGEFLAEKTETTIGEALKVGLAKPVHMLTKLDQMQVASVLRRLGFRRVDGWRDGRKQKYWERIGSAPALDW